MLLQELEKKGLTKPPPWLGTNCPYLTIMGSTAYGSSSDTSDWDIYGCCIPPKEMLFPHLAGEIDGFGTPAPRFEQFEHHHINDPSADAGKGRNYDLTVFSIVKYFDLCLKCNPNMIDSLFTPVECVVHMTSIGEMIRDRRKMFLHKGAWPRFKGYAYQQMHKIKTKTPKPGSKREHLIEEFGFDTKYASHVVRLLCEAEQIMVEGDLDLRRNSEQLKAIRKGEMTEAEIRKWFSEKELQLERVYHESTLPWGPDEASVKSLLLECLETHYGSLDKAVTKPNVAEQALRDIAVIVDAYRK